MFDSPHCQFNPLTREWILVSPHRAKCPWQGQVEKAPSINLPEYAPAYYLCPGNERVGGIHNPDYTGAYTFDNDFAALLPETATASIETHPLFTAQSEAVATRLRGLTNIHSTQR